MRTLSNFTETDAQELYNKLRGENLYLDIYIRDDMGEYPIPQGQGYQVIDVMNVPRLPGAYCEDPNGIAIRFSTELHNYLVENDGKEHVYITNESDPINLDYAYYMTIQFSNPEELMDWLLLFSHQVINAIAEASGDNAYYDYAPMFYYILENAFERFGLTEQVELLRKDIYDARPDYDEFFSDDEIEQFSKS